MSHLHHKVSALVDGELTGAARQRALRHVAKCAACHHELEETLALKARLSGLPSFEPSPDLFVSLGSLSAADHPDPVTGRGWAVGRRLVLGAGTFSVALLSLAYVVGGPDEPSSPQVAPPVDELRAAYGGAAGDDPLADTMVSGVRGRDEPQSSRSKASTPPVAATDPERPAGPVAVPSGDDSQALDVLRRASRAPADVSFAGTRQVTSYDQPGAPVQTLEVVHVAGQGSTVEASDTGESAFLPADPEGNTRLDVLVSSYDVAAMGTDVVLGRRASVVAVGRDGTLAAKVWVDDETGLVLQRELYDGDAVVRSTRFLDLDVASDGELFLNHVAPEPVTPPETDLGTDDAPRMRDAGWACPESLTEGFELTGLTQVETGAGVVHAEYTDGLSTVSLFSEPGVLDPSQLDGFAVSGDEADPVYVRPGLPAMVVWESDDTVYTLVSDAPATTVDAVVSALPHEPDEEPGVGTRVGAGLDKMATFLTPLG
jgi:sigma-E factor negative regulatory protein RseB